MARQGEKKKRRGLECVCPCGAKGEEKEPEGDVEIEPAGAGAPAPGEATEPAAEDAPAPEKPGPDTTRTVFSAIDRLFSGRSRSSSVVSVEAQETQKLQKTSRQAILVMGVLMSQVGFILIAIAFVRTVGNVREDMGSDSTLAGLKDVALVYTLDVVGECVLGYMFVALSKRLSQIALTPGRDVTGLATVELASLFHKYRFVLVFVCLWTAYDKIAVPLLRRGTPDVETFTLKKLASLGGFIEL